MHASHVTLFPRRTFSASRSEIFFFDEQPQEKQDRLLNTLTLRRWEDPREVANLVCFLASDLAGYITGTLLDVSGGKLATQEPIIAYEAAQEGGSLQR